jgi:addiction module RelE/StbE family toxin
MVEVVWTESAIQDLNDIAEYIAKDSARYAELTTDALFYATDILETYPNSGTKVPELNDESIRQLIRGNYRIVYKIISNQRIDILTVHNCARLISNSNPFKD